MGVNVETNPIDIEVIIVGAGFGGLHMLHKMRELGIPALVLESASDVGGCWFWNRYPGAHCDVESVFYSYSFSPKIDAGWKWSKRYASGDEIQAYLSYVADTLELRSDIRFERLVTAGRFDDATHNWTLETNKGEVYRARYVVLATGPLTVPKFPDIPGIDDFAGESYHTGKWPQQGVDFSGKRVGVIGTGSTGTQLIPAVAEQAGQLYAFVRTPNYTIPARNFELTEEHQAMWEANKAELRKLELGGIVGGSEAFLWDRLKGNQLHDPRNLTPEQRQALLEERWQMGGASVFFLTFNNILKDTEANQVVASFIRSKVAEVVEDPEVVETLTPSNYPFAAKRLCVDTGFYETFNRPNVEAVNCRKEPIEKVTATGIKTTDREIELDVIIYATGFDAMTGAVTAIDLHGKDGISIQDAWREGPNNYLGMAVSGFPNLFLIGGPGSPSALGNVVIANQNHVEFISNLILLARNQDKTSIEAIPAAQQGWVEHSAECAKQTLLNEVDSWYVGANVPGKPRVVLPYTGGGVNYKKKCDEVAAGDYKEGFILAD